MRIETTQQEAGQTFAFFDNQSDAIPQPIRPRMYAFGGLFWFYEYPHPLLCGPRGPITVLPDHMHEGEVIEPWDLSASFTFAGRTFKEYPTNAQGHQERPQIVAWGTVVPETNEATEAAHVGDPNNVAIERSFGDIGAYDGHRVAVGRVAVDSTWHHFFDINLIGDPVAPFPKNEGFKATPDGEKALADIEAYYRNTGMWIARHTTQSRLFGAEAWCALHSQPLNMLVSTRRSYSTEERMIIGSLALRNLVRHIPPCGILVNLLSTIVDGPVPIVPPAPWDHPQPGESVIDPSLLMRAALGESVLALAQRRQEIERMEPERAIEEISRVTNEGVGAGLRRLGGDVVHYARGLEQLGRGLGAE